METGITGAAALRSLTVPRYFPDGFAAAQPAADGLGFDPPPDYAAIAVAMGGHGELVERPDRIGPAVAGALTAIGEGRFALLDMHLLPVGRR